MRFIHHTPVVTAVAAVAGALFAFAASLAWALDESPAIPYTEREGWKEDPVKLPPYPDGQDLLPVSVQIPDSNLQLYLHEPSLTVGKDGVVRYTLVLRSANGGAENVFYEGIRCSTHELKSYAFGARDAGWQSLQSDWGLIRDLGVERYRERLYRYYLCQPLVAPLKRAEMLRRIRYGLPPDYE